MNINYGDIYRIYNTNNGKSYIGQARHYSRHGNYANGSIRYERRGWRVRVREHFYRILNDKDGSCPKLYRAVKKYGIESFIYHRIETCHIDDLDNRETWWIRVFNSFRNGYNASPGGGTLVLDYDRVSLTKQMQWFDQEKRDTLLLYRSDRKSTDLPSNIFIHEVDSQHTGYKVSIIRRGNRFSKVYGSGYNISMDEKLERALKWRDAIIIYMDSIQSLPIEDFISNIRQWTDTYDRYSSENVNGVVKYNVTKEKDTKTMKGRIRSNGLPTYVYELKKNGIHTGYQTMFTHNGIRYSKTYASTKVPMEEKIRLCIEWRDSKLNELSNNS